jgi:glutamine synthetase
VDPRGILKIATERAEALGKHCYAGVEYEYFNFKETPESVAEKKFHGLSPLTPGMHGYSMLRTQLNNQYFHDLFNMSERFGVQIESHHTETGPGVLETALAYTSALRMADNAILYKYAAKSIGMQHGVIPSFMAKPWGNLPGTSGHVHVSLRDANGVNIFAVPDDLLESGRGDAAFADTKYMSQEGEHFLAGLLDGIQDVMPMVSLLTPRFHALTHFIACPHYQWL